MIILSLGAGVQSSTVLLMSCRGELPKIDCAIFADTGWEPSAVYTHLDWLEGESGKAGIPIHRITGMDIRGDAVKFNVEGGAAKGQRWASMPLRSLDTTVVVGSNIGQIRRQCTNEYKIAPIEKFIRSEILGLKPRQRWPVEHVIDEWFGISLDEVRRMSMSKRPAIKFVYPLVGYPVDLLPKRMTRADCRKWLVDNYPDRTVPRSACLGCPYRSNEEWATMKVYEPSEWSDVVSFDKDMRQIDSLTCETYIHRDCKPLDEVDLQGSDPNQGDLFDEECSGMCGL